MTQHVNAEAAVLGSLMADPSLIPTVLGVLSAEHFEDSRYRRVFETILALRRKNAPVDAVTVTEALGRDQDARKLAFEIVQSVQNAVHADYYAREVVKAYHKRRVSVAAQALAADPEDDTRILALREAVRQMEAAESRIRVIKDMATAYLSELDERVKGMDGMMKTGIGGLDDLLGGLWRGGFVAIGGRPNAGKTSFMVRLAVSLCRMKRKILYISGESTEIDVMDIITAMTGGIQAKRLAFKADNVLVSEAAQIVWKTVEWPFYFMESGDLRLESIEHAVDSVAPDVVMVDYLQRFRVPKGADNRAAFYNDIAHGLKNLAIGRRIAVVMASQLNRAVEHREDKTPTLADFKETGGVEEAARLALLLHPRMETEADPSYPVDIIVAKNKGPMGKITMQFDKATLSFMAPGEELKFDVKKASAGG